MDNTNNKIIKYVCIVKTYKIDKMAKIFLMPAFKYWWLLNSTNNKIIRYVCILKTYNVTQWKSFIMPKLNTACSQKLSAVKVTNNGWKYYSFQIK